MCNDKINKWIAHSLIMKLNGNNTQFALHKNEYDISEDIPWRQDTQLYHVLSCKADWSICVRHVVVNYLLIQ